MQGDAAVFTWVWHPVSWGSYLWNILIFLLVLYTVLLVPFRLAFYWDRERGYSLSPFQKFGEQFGRMLHPQVLERAGCLLMQTL